MSLLQRTEARLKVDQPLLQRDAIVNVAAELEAQNPTSIITSPLLQLLVSNLTNKSISVSEQSTTAIVDLISKNKLDLKNGISYFLNSVPSVTSQTLPVVVKALTKCLLIEIQKSKPSKVGKYTCPYLNSSITHPYSAILKSRIETWPIILNEIIETLTLSYEIDSLITNKEVFAMYWPFIVDVLCDISSFSTVSSSVYHLSTSLHTTLVRIAHSFPSLQKTILNSLVSLLPTYSMYMNGVHSNISGSDSVIQISHISNIYYELIEYSYGEDLSISIIPHLLQFYNILKQLNISLSSYLYLYKSLVSKYPSLLLYDSTPLLLCYYLVNSSDQDIQLILNLLHNIIDVLQVNAVSDSLRVYLPFAVYPLLQIKSSPNKTISDNASKLLRKIELTVSAPPATSGSVLLQKLSDSKLYGTLSYFANSEQFILNFFKNLENEQIHDWVVEWVESVTDNLQSKEQITPFLLFFVAPFMLYYLPKVKISTTKLISKISKISSFQGLTLLSLLLYQLQHETDNTVQLSILYTIPTLATHSSCVSPILRVIMPLTKVQSMKPVSIRLLTLLWEYQPRTISKVMTFIHEYQTSLSLEHRISLALSIKDIIQKKPERGTELISVLSRMVSGDPHSTVVSVALQCLCILCEEEVVDFPSVWNLIAKNSQTDIRPLVLSNLASLMLYGSSKASTEDDAEKLFVESLVSRLWSFAKHSDVNVRREAVKSLIAYAQVNIDCLGTIPAANYAELLNETDEDTKRECEQLVFIITNYQLQHSRRRGMALGKEVGAITVINSSVQNLGKLPAYLRENIEKCTPSIRNALAGSLLYSVEPPPLPKESEKLTKIPRQYLVNKGQFYKRTFNDLITDISSRADIDWLSRSLTLHSLLYFMKDFTPNVIQAEIAQASLNGEDTEDRIAINRAVDNMHKDVLQKIEETPKLAENSIIALACFAYHLPSSAYVHLEKLVELFKSFIEKSTHEWMMYGSVVGIGLLTFKLQWTDSNRIESIVNLLINLLQNTNTTTTSQYVKMATATSLAYAAIGLYKNENEEEEEDISKSVSDQDKSKVAMVMKIVSVLKKFFEIKEDINESMYVILGSANGLGIVSYALQNSLEFDTIKSLYSSFLSNLKSTDVTSDSWASTGSALNLPAIVSRLFQLEQISSIEVTSVLEEYSNKISTIKDSSTMYSSALIIGYCSLLHYLVTCGYALQDTVIAKNIQSVIDLYYNNSSSSNVRIGVVIGLSNFLGNSQISCDMKSTSPLSSYSLSPTILTDPKYNNIVENILLLIKNAMETDSDTKVCRISAWILGSMCRPVPLVNAASTTSNVSNNSTNLFKYLFQILEESIQSSEVGATSMKLNQIPSILSCFSELTKLPAMRWEPVILGLMKAEFSNNNIRRECIEFAISHSKNVNSMLSILDEWTDPPRMISFSLPLQQEIVQGLPTLLSAFPSVRARKLLRDVFSVMFRINSKVKDEQEMNLLVLSTLNEVLSTSSIATTVIAELHQILLEIYDKLPSPSVTDNSDNNYRLDPYLSQLLEYVAICFKSLPNEIIVPKVTQIASQSTEYCVKSIYVGCILIVNDKLPLTTLSAYRTWLVSQLNSTEVNAISLFEVLSRPLRIMKDNEKTKWVLDCFDTITMCPNPAMCLRLLTLSLLLWSKEESSALFLYQFKYQIYRNGQFEAFDTLLNYLVPKMLEQSNFSTIIDRVLSRLNSLLTSANVKGIQHILFTIFTSLRHSTVKGVNFSPTVGNIKSAANL